MVLSWVFPVCPPATIESVIPLIISEFGVLASTGHVQQTFLVWQTTYSQSCALFDFVFKSEGLDFLANCIVMFEVANEY